MTSINIAALINLLGFTTGMALYAMLLVMVLRRPAHSVQAQRRAPAGAAGGRNVNWLLFATAILGLLWNAGALAAYGLRSLALTEPYPLLLAISFAALGFLPAVVVHSAVRSGESHTQRRSGARWITVVAYCLSAVAGLLQFHAALSSVTPSLQALRVLTVGYVALIVALFLSTRRQPGWERAIWASALAVFSVSALHLSQHHDGSTDAWFRELTGHHASLPLVLAILYQDYRFAFADIFLKRALALLALVGLAFGLYVAFAGALPGPQNERVQAGPRSVGILLGLWVGTALLYPVLQRGVVRFVDKVVLRRVDYAELRGAVASLLMKHESAPLILDEICRALAPALSAREMRWLRVDAEESEAGPEVTSLSSARKAVAANRLVQSDSLAQLATEMARRVTRAPQDACVLLPEQQEAGASAVIFVPTAESPYYALVVGTLGGGRRLLSDDVAMLESVSLVTARRIDALRVTHERVEQVRREQEMGKLASEAQLRALRAQINPHFLFNALTTIGYLVQTAPERALETLMKLTSLLRGSLRSSGEFVTLGEELKLIVTYLDIERARFEERLRVRVDVPEELLDMRVPALLVQPLVENAVKHGIAPARLGGEVRITARLEIRPGKNGAQGERVLCVTVADTGVGASEIELARGRRRGVGLANVEQRLACYGGQASRLSVKSQPGEGTVVELRIPVAFGARVRAERSDEPALSAGERGGA